MTKRIFSVMIALVMVVALAVPALAATPETSAPVDDPVVERYVPMPCCGCSRGVGYPLGCGELVWWENGFLSVRLFILRRGL